MKADKLTVNVGVEYKLCKECPYKKKDVFDAFEMAVQNARKDTAKEIFKKLIDELKQNVDADNVDYFVNVRKIIEEVVGQPSIDPGVNDAKSSSSSKVDE